VFIRIHVLTPAPPKTTWAETVELVKALDRRIVATKTDVRELLCAVRGPRCPASTNWGRLDGRRRERRNLFCQTCPGKSRPSSGRKTLDVNLTGVFHTAKAAIPHLIKQGTGGSIIFTSSVAGLRGLPFLGHYVAKANTASPVWPRTMASGIGGSTTIRVNTIHPHGVENRNADDGTCGRSSTPTLTPLGPIFMQTLPDPVQPGRRTSPQPSRSSVSDEAHHITGHRDAARSGHPDPLIESSRVFFPSSGNIASPRTVARDMTKTVVAQTYGTPEGPGAGGHRFTGTEIRRSPGRREGDRRQSISDFKLYSGAFGTDPGETSDPPRRRGRRASSRRSATALPVVAVGDEVIVSPGNGLYAEQVVVPVSSITAKPAGISWEQAAGLLLVGGTAVDAPRHHSRRLRGHRPHPRRVRWASALLRFQLAAARGATVIGTAGSIESGLRAPRSAPRRCSTATALEGPAFVNSHRTVSTPAFDTAGTDEAVDTSLTLVADKSRIVTIVAFGRAPDRRLRVCRRRKSGKCRSTFEGSLRTGRTSRVRTPHREDRQEPSRSQTSHSLHTELQSSHPAGKFHPHSLRLPEVP